MKKDFKAIGDTYQGGIIFYLDGNGGGLIAAPSDQSASAEWGCVGVLVAGGITGLDDCKAIGRGYQNTIDMINANSFTTNLGAADICVNLILGGHSDWFLPSKDELYQMYLNIGQGNALGLGNIGGFSNNWYWSSTDFSEHRAWRQYFNPGNIALWQRYTIKGLPNYVRAIRSF